MSDVKLARASGQLPVLRFRLRRIIVITSLECFDPSASQEAGSKKTGFARKKQRCLILFVFLSRERPRIPEKPLPSSSSCCCSVMDVSLPPWRGPRYQQRHPSYAPPPKLPPSQLVLSRSISCPDFTSLFTTYLPSAALPPRLFSTLSFPRMMPHSPLYQSGSFFFSLSPSSLLSFLPPSAAPGWVNKLP